MPHGQGLFQKSIFKGSGWGDKIFQTNPRRKLKNNGEHGRWP
mgnify:CR=1 FL=1